jgi:hypothetical protein
MFIYGCFNIRKNKSNYLEEFKFTSIKEKKVYFTVLEISLKQIYLMNAL